MPTGWLLSLSTDASISQICCPSESKGRESNSVNPSALKKEHPGNDSGCTGQRFGSENLSCTAKNHPNSTQAATRIPTVLQHCARFPVTSQETISRAAIQAGKSRKANRLVDVNSTWPKHMTRHVLLGVLFDCEVGNPLSRPKHAAEMSQQDEGDSTQRASFSAKLQFVISSLHVLPTT